MHLYLLLIFSAVVAPVSAVVITLITEGNEDARIAGMLLSTFLLHLLLIITAVPALITLAIILRKHRNPSFT